MPKSYKWYHSVQAARNDKDTLAQWVKGKISDVECARLISVNNGSKLDPKDLPEVVAGLGWIKGE